MAVPALVKLLPAQDYRLYAEQSPGRDRAEDAVRRIFRQIYGADIKDFAPHLLCAEQNRTIDTVVGLRHAQGRQLYLEHYLDQPIESTILAHHDIRLERTSLMELGNLVAVRSGSSRRLFILLAFALEAANIEWACFTATSQVKLMLARLGLKPLTLGKALQRQVASGASQWGRYYEDQPEVCFGNVFEAAASLRKSPMVKGLYAELENIVCLLATRLKEEFIDE